MTTGKEKLEYKAGDDLFLRFWEEGESLKIDLSRGLQEEDFSILLKRIRDSLEST